MDDEERQDQRENRRIVDTMKNGAKKAGSFIMKLRKFLMLVFTTKAGIILFVIIGVVALLAGLTQIVDIRGSTDITDVATDTIITQNTEIVQAPNPDDGYYFQISDDIIDQFLVELNRAYYEGRYLDHIKTGFGDEKYKDKDGDVNEVINGITSGISDGNVVNQSDFVYDPEVADIKEKDIQEWFNAEDYKDYLIKFIRAEIASMYPKLGDYQGLDTVNDSKSNPRDIYRKLCSTRCSTNSKNTYESGSEQLSHQ